MRTARTQTPVWHELGQGLLALSMSFSTVVHGFGRGADDARYADGYVQDDQDCLNAARHSRARMLEEPLQGRDLPAQRESAFVPMAC